MSRGFRSFSPSVLTGRHHIIKSFAILRIGNFSGHFAMELKFNPSDLCLYKTFSFKKSCSYLSLKPQVGIRSKNLVSDPYQISKLICAGISFPRRSEHLNAKVGRVCFDNYIVKASGASNKVVTGDKSFEFFNAKALGDWLKRRLGIIVLVYCVIRCNNVFAIEGVVNCGEKGIGAVSSLLQNAWPKFLQVMNVFKEQGLVLAALLGLSAFFSMAETSIMTLWPWKVRELAEKETENGVFKMLHNDVTRVLTTILIGTTVVNIGATALVTEAATTIFGEAGVSAATGIMTVAILLLTEITPKSIAVHHAADVARFVVRPVAWLSVVLYPVGRVVTFLSVGILKLLGLKGRSEPNVTEEELKLMLRVAELSGAIEEEEQDMIEKVLEIKDTHVREVMTPLVDVMAIDECSTYVDFCNSWVTHQYSRVPVFEERIDNIVGIAYAMDLLDSVRKEDIHETSTVRDMVQPAYFVPDSMSVWNLLREFRIRKVHMAVVLNEYGGTVGIVTLEDVVEEIVGEIFDENDSKEEIQRKTGYIIKRDDGVFDVDASTSIDQLCEDLCIRLPEGHQYETVSGFVCEAFGSIPRIGEVIKVVLERAEREEENNDYDTKESRTQHSEEKHQIYRLEILAGTARKVSSVRFELVNHDLDKETAKVTHLVPKLVKKKLKVIGYSDKSDDEDTQQETSDDKASYINGKNKIDRMGSSKS